MSLIIQTNHGTKWNILEHIGRFWTGLFLVENLDGFALTESLADLRHLGLEPGGELAEKRALLRRQPYLLLISLHGLPQVPGGRLELHLGADLSVASGCEGIADEEVDIL